MAFVTRRLQPTNLLLRGFQLPRQLLLGQAGFLAQRRQLEGHVPRRTRLRRRVVAGLSALAAVR